MLLKYVSITGYDQIKIMPERYSNVSACRLNGFQFVAGQMMYYLTTCIINSTTQRYEMTPPCINIKNEECIVYMIANIFSLKLIVYLQNHSTPLKLCCKQEMLFHVFTGTIAFFCTLVTFFANKITEEMWQKMWIDITLIKNVSFSIKE